jgi:DnaJ-class molecular chaperone
MKTLTRIAKEVRLRDHLERQGYRWRQCPNCAGSRRVKGKRRKCGACDGTGGSFVLR